MSISKCFLVIFAIFCCLQLLEAARVPRDDTAAGAGGNSDAGDTLQKLLAQVESVLNNDAIKKALADAGKMIEGQFANVAKTVNDLVEKRENTGKA